MLSLIALELGVFVNLFLWYVHK